MKDVFSSTIGYSHPGEVEVVADMVQRDYILDVGCGGGDLEVVLERKGFKHITSLDMSQKSLDALKSKTKKIKTVLHNLKDNLPFKDKEFNTVVCCEVLEHIENPMQVIRECLRVGKECILAIPNGFWGEMTPRNWTLPENWAAAGPNFFAPTKKWMNSTIYWLDGEILEWNYYYTPFLRPLRALFPRWLSTSFLLRVRSK